MDRIDLLDSGFLYLETREAPMHVASLNLFEFPPRVNQRKFMARLDAAYRSTTELRKPFAHRVAHGALGRFGPLYWEADPDIDLDYHIQRSALPKPGRYRELFALVSRLHSTLLDRSRPLWEYHIIDGLDDVERERVCRSLRRDDHVINAAKREDEVVAWLENNPNSYAVVNYTTYKDFADRTAANPIDAIEPSEETIGNNRYPLVTGAYVYVKNRHAAQIPGLQEFLFELTSERALAPDGYLIEQGLVSLDDRGRNRARDKALKLGL